MTAAGLFLVVGAVALFLVQTVQISRASQSGPVARPTSPPVQAAAPPAVGPESAAQPAPARPGEGPVRVTSRVIEPSYTVAAGDTLGSIASRSGTSVEALQSINNLADRNVLSVGQRLVIPNQP